MSEGNEHPNVALVGWLRRSDVADVESVAGDSAYVAASVQTGLLPPHARAARARRAGVRGERHGPNL